MGLIPLQDSAKSGDSAAGIRPAFRQSFFDRTLVLIPALNEAENIENAVHYWRNHRAALVRVADNGSVDQTAAQASAAGAEVVSEPRRGYGAACWSGLLQIPGDIEWILFSSADGSDRLSDAEIVAWNQAVVDGFELILGDRCSHPASRRHLKPVQRFGNRLSSLLLQLGWGQRTRDMGSLRMISTRLYREIELADRGFGWNVEMHVRAIECGACITEIPVGYFPRAAGRSKISGTLVGSFRAGSIILKTFWKLWWTRDLRSSSPTIHTR